MKDYEIVEDTDVDVFKNKVKELLNNGWDLAGGVAVDRSYFYYQALVKETPIC